MVRSLSLVFVFLMSGLALAGERQQGMGTCNESVLKALKTLRLADLQVVILDAWEDYDEEALTGSSEGVSRAVGYYEGRTLKAVDDVGFGEWGAGRTRVWVLSPKSFVCEGWVYKRVAPWLMYYLEGKESPVFSVEGRSYLVCDGKVVSRELLRDPREKDENLPPWEPRDEDGEVEYCSKLLTLFEGKEALLAAQSQ